MNHTHYYIYARVRVALAALLALLLASCKGDYRNAIPKGSTAIVAIDASALFGEEAAGDGQRLGELCKSLHVDNVHSLGIDLGETFYGFETADGTLGLVLPVSSEGDVDAWLDTLKGQGVATEATEKKGYKFAFVGGSFLLGYSSTALVAVGPVVAAEKAEMQRRMAKWLDNGDDASIKDTKLYAKLGEMQGAVRLVARCDALPEQLAALLTLVTPKGTQPQEVYASLAVKASGPGFAEIEGGAFSFDEGVEQALRKVKDNYKPIRGGLLAAIPDSALFAMACGVKGDEYLQMLRSNEEIRTMLFGANTMLDIDKMLRSVDGDLLIGVEAQGGDASSFFLLAEQANASWLKDVGYWRKTCPNGTTIAPAAAPQSYVLRTPDYTLRFGIDADSHLYIANHPITAQQPTAGDIRAKLTGKRLGVVVNVRTTLAAEPYYAAVGPLVNALLGGADRIVYTIE